jgi:hypothetical protein
MKLFKIIGIFLLMFGCAILITIKWLLWIPYMLLGFPFTERFMHEYDLVCYPSFWFEELKEKL